MVKLTLGIVKIFAILLAFNSPLLAMQGKSTSIQSVKKKTQPYFEVMQNEILLTNVRYPTRFLFTGGLGPCVGLILQAGDWIAFAHLDGSPMTRTLNKVIAEVKDLSNHHPIEATIVTSRAPWELTFRRLISILNDNKITYHHIKENTEDSNVLMDKRHKDISTGSKNPGIKSTLIHNPDWNLGSNWSRRPGQYPMLKLIRQGEGGEFVFNPDSVEKHLALRHHSAAKDKPPVQEEKAFLEESALLKEKSKE